MARTCKAGEHLPKLTYYTSDETSNDANARLTVARMDLEKERNAADLSNRLPSEVCMRHILESVHKTEPRLHMKDMRAIWTDLPQATVRGFYDGLRGLRTQIIEVYQQHEDVELPILIAAAQREAERTGIERAAAPAVVTPPPPPPRRSRRQAALQPKSNARPMPTKARRATLIVKRSGTRGKKTRRRTQRRYE